MEAVLGDFWSRIGVGIGEGRMLDRRIEKFVKGAEAAAGKNQLPTDLRRAAAHEVQKLDLLLGGRSEIGGAAFGGANTVAQTVPGQEPFGESSGRRVEGHAGV